MSSFAKHGQTGGSGVKRPGGQPPHRPSGGGRQGGGYGGHRDRSQPDDIVPNHWPNYLAEGYFDEQGNLRIEYVSRCLPGDEHLPDNQQHGCEPLIRAMADANPKLTTGQIRRFFGHCRTLETKLKSGAATWAELRPDFQFLDAAAQDAYGKDKPKIPGLFFDFIKRNVAAVHTKQDFLDGFLKHFEALMGFGSTHIQRERN